jgi:hypothetical protein
MNKKKLTFEWNLIAKQSTLIYVGKDIGDEELYYSTEISIFSFIWAGLAASHRASTM